MKNQANITNEELHQLHIIDLELVCEVDRICRKNNIEYSLDGGSLIGAIRDKGIIPWDDDADVIFTRAEYKKFEKACEKDLNKEKFFFQNYKTDPGYRWRYAKMRRNNTKFIRTNQEHMTYHNGVYIDIFVLDNVPDNKLLRSLYLGFNYCTRKMLYSEVGKIEADSTIIKCWYKVIDLIPKNWIHNMQNTVWNRFNRKPSERIYHNGYPYINMPKLKYGVPSYIFSSYTDVEFEGIKMRAVSAFNEYLMLGYGDYMTPPPEDKRCFNTTFSKLELISLSKEDVIKEYSTIK